MKETPHKACPTVFTQSANAPYAQSLCGVALREGETKLSESTEEDEVLRSRKRKLDMEAESDGEQLREQLRLHLEDKRILNGDAGKRLRRDFGRLLKSGEEGVPMADIDYEIYKYINELADQYIELDDLLELIQQYHQESPVL